MSQLMGGPSGQSGVSVGCMPNDIRNMPTWQIDMDPFMVVRIRASWDLFMGFTTPWWPGGVGMDSSGGEMLSALWANAPELIEPKGGGTNSRFGIFGIVRDAYGTPVGGAIVKLFRTTGDLYKDEKVDEGISDPLGNYFVSTPFYPDAHYIVVYKQGSPDIFGSSPNTLIGS